MPTRTEAHEDPLSGGQDRTAIAALLALAEPFINAAARIDLDRLRYRVFSPVFRW